MKLGKKLLSLLTVLCLTLSLFPTMALADGDVGVGGPPNRETSVTVGSATLNSNTPYLVKDKTAAQRTITSEEESQGYIQFTSNGQITLNNYTGSSKISITGNLTINLVGTNKITTSGNNSIYSDGALTIMSSSKGSLTAENRLSGSAQTTIYSTSNITITGNATVTAKINGTAQAINSHSENGKITIADHATVTATNTNNTTSTENGIAILAGNSTNSSGGTIEVKGSATLTAQGYGKALACKSMSETSSPKGFTYPDGATITVSQGYSGTPTETYDENSLGTYKYVNVTPAVVTYNVWVGGTQVTSANASNVLNDSNTTHAVTYDPATKTLTLTDATITGAPNRQYTSNITDACGIYAKHDLTIKLIGDNNKVQGAAEQPDGSYGIFVSGRLTFTSASGSNGSITVSGGTSNNSGNAWVPGVYASGITVNNCNVTAIGGTASDRYPVAYAMSKAPTLVGAEVVATNTTNSDKDTSTEYNASSIRQYKYLKITQKKDDTVAAPVITPEGGYFTSDPHVTISCPTEGATIYYTTDGTAPKESSEKQTYDASTGINLNATGETTIKAIAVKNNVYSDPVIATFTQRTGDAVTAVALDVSVDTHKLTLKVGDTQTLSAAVKHEATTINDVDVTWTSDNKEVADVDANGKITALAVGKARVTAAVVENGVTYSDFCDVIVEAQPSSSHHSSSSTTYYDVNAAVSGEGGSVAASTKRASRGTTVTVTATAASGYQVAQVSAVDKDGKAVSLTDKGDGVYTFVMPASKVDVTARFAQVQKPEEKDPYGDVSKDSYYYDAVKWAAETGVTTGVGDGLFAPEWVCTRGQIVTFLWRASGSPAPKATELPFTDVAADAYYAQAVLWAVENGITNGTSETTFSPDQTCTRAHAVAFLYRMSGSPAAAGSTFSDVAADAYYRAAVAWAVEKGITNGTSGTTFSPDDTCTRGQIVTFLYRLAQTK